MIALDTNAVIWGVQGVAAPGQEALVSRTRKYLTAVAADGEAIAIPAPVLQEFLAWFPPEEHARWITEIQRRFFVPGLDAGAAAVAALLGGDQSRLKDISTRFQVDRQVVRIDIQVIAIAIQHSCRVLVSHDPHLIDLAQSRISVIEVPDLQIGEQLPLLTRRGSGPGR